ncbi:MAG: RDD family protein [Planctomycetaceae bacterium]
MPINVTCPGCEQQYNVPDEKAGRKFRCKQCQEIVSIPDAAPDSRYADPSPTPSRRSNSRRGRDDDFEDDYDDEDDIPSPRSRRSGRSGRRGSRSRGRRSGGRGNVASLGKRFLGSLIDGFFGVFLILPGYFMMMVGADGDSPELAMTGMIVTFGGGVVVLGVQIFLLATKSQSLGKFFIGTRIHDYESGDPASPVQTILLRMFVNGFIAICGIYRLIDILFIFGDEHRCLHDMIASTYVADVS